MIRSAEIVAGILILGGTILSFISSIGMIRLPDVYTRNHAASKSTTLGVLSILLGVFIYFLISDGVFLIRLILGIFFVFLTAPVSAHMIARSAYKSNAPLAETTAEDELKDYYQQQKMSQN